MNEIQAIRANDRRRRIEEARKMAAELNAAMKRLRQIRREHPELFPALRGDSV